MKKLPNATRGIFITAFLLLVASLVNTRPVQSAYPNAPAAGTLQVINDLVNDNGGSLIITDFEFSINAGVDWIQFEGDGQNDLAVPDGTYTVIGRPEFGYSTTYTTCENVEILGNVLACTITNNDISPELTIIKEVINDSGGGLSAGNFTINITGTNVSSPSFPGAVAPGTTVTLNAGSYGVNETAVPGYSPTYSTDCNGTIAVGETKTCTITNDDYARLTIVKDPTNDNGGTAEPDDFQLTVGGSPVLSGVTIDYPIGIPLAINETQLVGYTFVGITDDGSLKCPGTLGGTITMAFGDDITCTIVNDDIPAIKAVPAADLVTVEDGTTDTFTVVLTTVPSNDVTITVSSSDPTEGTVSPGVLPFTTVNWNIPQEVTVTGVDDLVADGDIVYNVVLDPSGSTAIEYAGLAPVQINALNYDDDTPGYIISPTENLITTEGEGAQKVTISLRSRPTGPVSLNFDISDPSEGKASPTSLIIDPTTWPQPPAEVIITGVDDCQNDGNIPYTLTINASSTDSFYTGLVGVLPITNYDAPTIKWVKPVEDEDIHYVENLTPVLLEVEKICPEPIFKVRFYRWVASAGDWATIGEDLLPPYQESLAPLELEVGWNEVRAFAFSPPPAPGGIQTYSKHPYILIRRDFGGELRFLPVIKYNP